MNNVNLGLLLARVGLGVMFVLHGVPKLAGGPEQWEAVGQSGLPFLSEGAISVAAGLLAALTETLGGLLLALGLFFPWVPAAMCGVMIVAFTTKLGTISGVMDFAYKAGWPLEMAIIFAALAITGPGTYAMRLKKGTGKSE
ncbi:MAG: DoxX family protein [Opitutales bacterium]